MSKLWRAHGALLLVNLIYGANYFVAKKIMSGYMTPAALIFLRVVGTTLLLWLLMAFQRERIERKDMGRLALCGLLGVCINQLLYFKGMSLTTEINASIIMTSGPIMVLFLSALLLKEKITKFKLSGILLGCIGAVGLIGFSSQGGLSGGNWWGDLMVFINALSYGTYLVVIKPLMVKYKPITVMSWAFLMGMFMVVPISIGDLLQTDWSAMDTGAWLSVLYVVLCTTFIAYLLNIYALKFVQPAVSSSYIYMQSIFVAIVAYVLFCLGWFPETATLNWQKAIFMALIFTGVFLTSWGDRIWKR